MTHRGREMTPVSMLTSRCNYFAAGKIKDLEPCRNASRGYRSTLAGGHAPTGKPQPVISEATEEESRRCDASGEALAAPPAEPGAPPPPPPPPPRPPGPPAQPP